MVSAISSAMEKRAFLNNSKAIGSWISVIAPSPHTTGSCRWNGPLYGDHTTISGQKSPLPPALFLRGNRRRLALSYAGERRTGRETRGMLWHVSVLQSVVGYRPQILWKAFSWQKSLATSLPGWPKGMAVIN